MGRFPPPGLLSYCMSRAGALGSTMPVSVGHAIEDLFAPVQYHDVDREHDYPDIVDHVAEIGAASR
jgi:hypothetical protein